MRLQEVTGELCRNLDLRKGFGWWALFCVSLLLLISGTVAVAYQIRTGIGTWGVNRTVGWAFDITNFVFWIGIGHAGTFISAILFLLRQRWRVSISRSAEAATLLALVCAAVFPVIHMGRPWLAFWMVPYPNYRGPLWINFRSPLVWDFFAIVTYFLISLVFFYLGLLPDLATLRDRSTPGLRKRVAGWLSLGWDGSQATWHRWQTLYMLLAGLATALVISVHTIVSWDFAASILPGWHSTVFPPYFVVGAVFSGLAMVTVLALGARWAFGLEDYVSSLHIERVGKVILFCSWIIGLVYAGEIFHSFYQGSSFELRITADRLSGPMALPYVIMVCGNVLVPQLLWWERFRRSTPIMIAVSTGVLVGMWMERFVIIVGSLYRDYLPSSWSSYLPTSIEVATLAGSFGLFFCGYLLFVRALPIVPISETKSLLRPRAEDSATSQEAGA
jgi:molybdopterin-containing oxidoreductase family membrane subunit